MVLKRAVLVLWWGYSLVYGPLLLILEVTTIGSHAGSQGIIFQQDGASAHTASVMQNRLKANCPRFIEKNQWCPKLQIWTHGTIISEMPCQKSTLNSRRSARRLMKSRYVDPLGRAVIQEHINSRYLGDELHLALDCLYCCQWCSLRAQIIFTHPLLAHH